MLQEISAGRVDTIALIALQINDITDGIKAQAITMADGEPEIGSRLEERAHDRFDQIEVARSPLAQPYTTVIGVFIECRTIKTCESIFVRYKVNGHKVHNDTDAVLVALVNQIAEIFWCAIA